MDTMVTPGLVGPKRGVDESADDERTREAPGGFEPPNRGFADRCLRPLGYGATCQRRV